MHLGSSTGCDTRKLSFRIDKIGEGHFHGGLPLNAVRSHGPYATIHTHSKFVVFRLSKSAQARKNLSSALVKTAAKVISVEVDTHGVNLQRQKFIIAKKLAIGGRVLVYL